MGNHRSPPAKEVTLSQEARSLYAEKNPVPRQVSWAKLEAFIPRLWTQESHPKVSLDGCECRVEGTQLFVLNGNMFTLDWSRPCSAEGLGPRLWAQDFP